MVDASWRPRSAVAVLGGSLRYTDQQIRAGFLVGRELARMGKVVVTGATSGVPYAAALGAHAADGLVVGISPAASADEHLSSGKPLWQADVVIYTGMGTEGRSPLILRSVQAAVFVGGEFGTLGEFCSGWISGVPVLGVLEGVGGLTDSIPSLVQAVASSWGSRVVYSADPRTLTLDVARLVESLPTAIGHVESGDDVRDMLGALAEPNHAGR